VCCCCCCWVVLDVDLLASRNLARDAASAERILDDSRRGPLKNRRYTRTVAHPPHCILKLPPSTTRAIPKVSGLDILDNNISHNLYISETYILYELQ